MRRALLVSVLVPCLLGAGAAARAEDPPAPAGAAGTARADLGGLRVGAAAVGPRLVAPSDAVFPGFEEEEPAELFLLKFPEPPWPQHAFSPDLLEDLVKRQVPEAGEGEGSVRLVGDALEVRAAGPALERARAAARDAIARLAPRLPVRATLADGGTLLAAGGVSLAPRRWTAIWFRRDVRRAVVGFRPEVATEVVANQPAVASLVEGTEAYARWSPGERTSLLEVWLGAVEPAGETEVDLSVVRNVPETNSMGTARLPRTALRRVATAVALPAGAASEATASLAVAGRTLTLRLSAGPEAAPEGGEAREGAGPLGLLRVGALGVPLEGGTRPPRADEAVRRLQAAAGRLGGEGPGPEALGPAFAAVAGPRERLATLRAEVVAEEERLAPAVLELRAVAVPAEGLAEAFHSGRLAVGRAVAAGAAPAAAGDVVARVPVVSGVAASLRAGTSIVGLAELPAAIADRAGGLGAVPVGRFDGLAATARAVRGEAGAWTLAVEGSLSWARADGSRATLAFRPPVAIAFRTYHAHPEDPTVRRVEVPLLADGRTDVDATVRLSAAEVAEGTPVLLAVGAVPAGPSAAAHAVLLLGSLRKSP